MTQKNLIPAKTLACFAGLTLGGVLLFAGTDWSKKDASTWTDEDARTILSDSPWAKQAKLSSGENGNMGNGGRGGRGGMGGMGGGGMGGGGIGGLGGGGMGRGTGGGGWGGNNGGGGTTSDEGGGRQPDTPVTVEWYSAKPVRLALQKRNNEDSSKAAPIETLDHYVIAIVGFPASTGRRRNADSDDSNDSDRDPNQMSDSMQNRLKDGAMITRKGHDPIHPDKVAWDNSSGTRTLMLYFPKTDAITASEKEAEVQVALGRMQLKKKFALKDMNYGGNLEL